MEANNGTGSTNEMQAAVFYGPNKISVQKTPYFQDRPALKVNSCAVCSYDVRVFRNGHRKVSPPIILGHEVCGQLIESVHTTNGTINEGTRLALCPIIPCLDCVYCFSGEYNMCINLKEIGSTHHGGFAQYLSIPKQTIKIGGLVKVPDSLSDEESSLLEPLACCLNGLKQLGPIKDARPVVVIGDGPIGLLHLELFKNLVGARTAVIGKVESRMQKARSMGADAVFEHNECIATEVSDYTGRAGASVIVIATSNPAAFDLAEKVAGKNSKISLFAGMPSGQKFAFDANWLHYNQVSIIGTFSSLPPALEEAARIAVERTVDLSKIVTHRYSLAEVEKAIKTTETYSGLRAVINKF